MLCKRGLKRRLTPEITRSTPRASSWTCAQCRSYAAASNVHGKRPHSADVTHSTRTYASVTRRPLLPRTVLGTVTTNTPSQTTIEQLLEPLQTAQEYPADIIPSSSTHARLSILITPSFAQHALDQQLPLKAYELLRVNKNGLTTFETVTAVVDRLPAVTEVSEKPTTLQEGQQEGQEGLAYFLTPEARTELESTDEHTSPQEPVIGFRGKLATPFQGRPGTLTFSMPGNASHLLPNHTVELPLAQTIFSTQRVSTLIRTIYAVDDEQRLHVQIQQEPRSLNVNLPTRSRGHIWSVQLPLLPLTPARQVKYSMGNILRQLWHATSSTTGQSSGHATPQPASQELEAAVSSYFDIVGLDAQAVAVWALIVPKTIPPVGKTIPPEQNKATRRLLRMQSDEIRKSWLQRGGRHADPHLQRQINFGILGAIYNGAKLCKVLSGGGGWGKKAGLLSLDPDNSYDVAGPGNLQSNTAKIPSMDWKPFDEDTPSAFGQIAEVGDMVMFFLAPAGLNVSKISTAQTEPVTDVDDTIKTSPAFVFGALPSSIDTVPATTQSSTEVKITHDPSVFGMLSEGGMALELSSPPGARPLRDVIRTKLDVPFARFNGTKGSRVVVRKPVDKVLQEDVETPESNHHVLENQTARARRRFRRFHARGPKFRHFYRRMHPRFFFAGNIDQQHRFAMAQWATKLKSRTERRKRLVRTYPASPSTIRPFSESRTQRSPRSLRKQASRNRIYGEMTRSTTKTSKGVSLIRRVQSAPPIGARRVRGSRIRPRKILIDFDYVEAPKRFRARQMYDRKIQASHRVADVFDLMTRSEVYGPAVAGGGVVDGVGEDLRRELVEDVEGLVRGRRGDEDGEMEGYTAFRKGSWDGAESREDSAVLSDRLVNNTESQDAESKDEKPKDEASKVTFTPF